MRAALAVLALATVSLASPAAADPVKVTAVLQPILDAVANVVSSTAPPCDETIDVPTQSGGEVIAAAGLECDSPMVFLAVDVELLYENVAVATGSQQDYNGSSVSASASVPCVPGGYHTHARYVVLDEDGNHWEWTLQTDDAFHLCV